MWEGNAQKCIEIAAYEHPHLNQKQLESKATELMNLSDYEINHRHEQLGIKIVKKLKEENLFGEEPEHEPQPLKTKSNVEPEQSNVEPEQRRRILWK